MDKLTFVLFVVLFPVSIAISYSLNSRTNNFNKIEPSKIAIILDRLILTAAYFYIAYLLYNN